MRTHYFFFLIWFFVFLLKNNNKSNGRLPEGFLAVGNVEKQEVKYHLTKIVVRERDMVILGEGESWFGGRFKNSCTNKRGRCSLGSFPKGRTDKEGVTWEGLHILWVSWAGCVITRVQQLRKYA